jgi:hypothetical protein
LGKLKLIPHNFRGKKLGTLGPGALRIAFVRLASWCGKGVTKATIGSWSERMDSHTGTETRPRLLREAAVGNIGQWGQP